MSNSETFEARKPARFRPDIQSTLSSGPYLANSTDHSRSTFASVLPDLSLIGVAIIWGMNIPIMKVALGLLDNVYVFNALRLPVSALVLLGFAMRERRQGILPHASVRFSQIAVYALAVSVMYQLVFLIGMDHTTPGNAALILATVPMWTAILAWVFIGERLRGISWVGMFVALAGTIVVAFQSNSISADRTLVYIRWYTSPPKNNHDNHGTWR